MMDITQVNLAEGFKESRSLKYKNRTPKHRISFNVSESDLMGLARRKRGQFKNLITPEEDIKRVGEALLEALFQAYSPFTVYKMIRSARKKRKEEYKEGVEKYEKYMEKTK